jgi:hypothetical protein
MGLDEDVVFGAEDNEDLRTLWYRPSQGNDDLHGTRMVLQ